jgi:hypothetical protein
LADIIRVLSSESGSDETAWRAQRRQPLGDETAGRRTTTPRSGGNAARRDLDGGDAVVAAPRRALPDRRRQAGAFEEPARTGRRAVKSGSPRGRPDAGLAAGHCRCHHLRLQTLDRIEVVPRWVTIGVRTCDRMIADTG